MTEDPPRPWVENAKAALLFGWLLLTICAYYILRPVRSAMVMDDFGPRMLPWVYVGTAICTGIAVWIYSRFAHLPRRKLIGGVLGFFLSNFLVLWWLVQRGSSWVSPVLYIWTDVFSIMSPTVFWMYATDVYSPDEAKRAFGKIGAAGMVGAFIGAALTKTLVARLGVPAMMLIAGGLYSLILVLMAGLESLTGGRSAKRGKAIEKFDEFSFGDLGSVVRAVAASRTLSLLVALVALERFVPDFVDYIFSTAMHHAYPERTAFAGAFATFELWRNALVFVGSFFVTSHVLRRAGVHAALASVPVTIALLGGLYAVVPALAVVFLLKGLEEGQRHAWFKAGKEVIYTATNQDVIFKVKAYIEMFIYRLGRGFAGLALLLLTEVLGLGPGGVAGATVPLALGWCWVAWRLGSVYEALDGERKAASARVLRPAPAGHAEAAGYVSEAVSVKVDASRVNSRKNVTQAVGLAVVPFVVRFIDQSAGRDGHPSAAVRFQLGDNAGPALGS